MKDPLLLSYTQEELQIEYFMDWIENDPMQEFPQEGGVQFRGTGDTAVDEWEAAIAKGETPDFEKHVDPEFLERFKRYSKNQTLAVNPSLASAEAEAAKETEPVIDLEDLSDTLEGFEDSYDEE